MTDVTEGVKKFLCRLGLDRYYDMFIAKGFDSEGDICYLDNTDLDAMYIVNDTDRRTLLRSAANFKLSKEYLLHEWLSTKGLEYYYISFVQSELTDIAAIGRLNLPDEELYDELEVTLPGHRRRLERAVRDLSKKHRTTLPRVAETELGSKSSREAYNAASLQTPETEVPVAYGRWGKPKCLADAKYDFLILDATVLSTNDSRDKVDLEFMVDSGSDVVTIRQEVLDTMDLELIGPIQSKGVHASRRKNLYRANLQIGNQVVEIEVMGESYDSIGSRVIRHFRHYINGGRHIWLKGDFLDETMVERPHPTTSVNPSIKVPTGKEETVPAEKQEDISLGSEELPPLAKQHEDMEEGDATLPTQKSAEVKVQKDYVSVRKEENGIDLESHTTIEHIKIDFDFKKSDEQTAIDKEIDENDVDETDRLFVCENEESNIIDVRPIIAANRKRHANEVTGFDPSAHKLENVKKKRLHSDDNTIRTISTNNNLVHDMDNLNVQTVMKKRSVYYRAQARDSEGS